MLNAISGNKLKTRFKMIQRWEKSESGSFSRQILFSSAHLIQDDGQFFSFLFNHTCKWRIDGLPPNVHNRVQIFAVQLGVTEEEVVSAAATSDSVCTALFKREARRKKIIETFASVHVTGLALLKHAKFFEHTSNDVRMAVDIVRKLYNADHFALLHLSETFSLLHSRRLLVIGPRKQLHGMTISRQRLRHQHARNVLLRLGYFDEVINEVPYVLDFDSDRFDDVFKENKHFAEGVKHKSADEQIQSLNLLQYFLEKDMPDVGSKDDRYDDEDDPETEV